MKIVFWLFAGLVFFIYFIYPLIIFIIARMRRCAPIKGDYEAFVSVVVPMHNEERSVRNKLNNLLSLDYPREKLEILFVLDGCTDKTREYLSEYAGQGIRVIDNLQRCGKVAAMNSAVAYAQGEILVFTDANSMHDKDSMRILVRNFVDARVGCVAGRLVYTSAECTTVGKGENLYWRYENFIKRQESRLGKLLITNGSLQAVRKDIYPFPDPEIADDFSIPLLIQAKGYKVIYEPKAIVYEVATQSLREEFKQKVRIVSQGIKGIARLSRVLFLRLSLIGLFELFFHKVLRWGVGFYLIIIYLANIALWQHQLYANLLILQTAFYALALIGFIFRRKIKIRVFYIPFYFCLVNFSSIYALLRIFRGEKTHVWEKANSTRPTDFVL